MKLTSRPFLVLLTASALGAALPLAATAQVEPVPEELPAEAILEEPTPELLTPTERRLLTEGAPEPGAEPTAAPGEIDPYAEKMPLRLADAVAMGLENNLQLQIDRFDPLIAFEDQEGAWGSFDPTGTVEWDYVSNTEPVSVFSLQGSERNRHKEHTGKFGLSTLLPYVGATLGVDLNIGKTNDIGSPFIVQRPSYESGIKVQGSLPLLKGLIWNEPWTRVKTSEAGYRGSKDNFRTDLMNVVQFIETGYWDLVAQIQAVRVAEKSLETARSLLDQTQTQYEVGVKSKVEVVEAEAGVASREFDLIRAVNRYRRAQDDLIDSVLGTQLSAGSRLEVEPKDDPENYVNYQINTEDAARTALTKRPELAEAQSRIEQQEFRLKFAKNQWLPQLDVRASYGTAGRRGEGGLPATSFDPNDCFPMTPPCTVASRTSGDSVGDSFKDWDGDGGETVTVGALFSIPLGNISARRSLNRSKLELRRAKTRVTRLRQDIILEVRDGARNLESAQEGIEASERRRIAAAEQLRAEQVRLEYGESTPFKVLEKEQDLVEAENEKILALFTYRKSVVDLHRAQGTILKARNIVVEEAATLR